MLTAKACNMTDMEVTSHAEGGAAGDNKYNAMKNFEIDKKIGKGQFSEVYRARCVVDNTTVALKKVQVFYPNITWYRLYSLVFE